MPLAVLLGSIRSCSGDGDSLPPLRSVWTGGFERGFDDYIDAPWNFEGNGAPALVRRPLRTGRQAAAFTLKAGDQRQELVPGEKDGRTITFGEGDDLYFGFSTFLPSSWPSVRTWQLITQWKAAGAGSPPISIIASSYGSEDFQLIAAGWPGGGSHEVHNLGRVTRDRWIDWIVRVKFSSDPRKSRVVVWRDGKRLADLSGWRPSFDGERGGSRGGTLRLGKRSYLKAGIYRDPRIAETGRLWMDRWMIAERK